MKYNIWILLAGLFFYSCSNGSQKNSNSNNKEVTNEDEISEEIKSPYPTISVGKGPDALFLTPDEQILYVANVEDTIITIINTQTDQAIQAIEGVRNPWGFTRLGGSNLVAVSGYDKQLAVIDFTTHQIVRQKQFESHLGGITSSQDGKFLYVISIDEKKALKIDAESLEVVDQFDTGNGPDGIGRSKDGSKLYVTNTEDGTISIIDIPTKVSRLISKGGKPELIHPAKDNLLLLISNFHNNEAYMLNTESDEIVHTITELNGPEEVVMSDDDSFIYVVNFNNQQVYIYETTNYTRMDQEFTVGKDPIGLELAGSKAYVSNYGDNTVSVVNLNSH